MKLYIAGPMAGLPDHNFPAFHAMAEKLRADGHDVMSPAESVLDADLEEAINSALAWTSTKLYQQYLKRDIHMVLQCDGVVLLPGWVASNGATLEVHVAKAVGLAIFEPGMAVPS